MSQHDAMTLPDEVLQAVAEWREGLRLLRSSAPDLAAQVEASANLDAEWQAICTMADWQEAGEAVTVHDAIGWGVVADAGALEHCVSGNAERLRIP